MIEFHTPQAVHISPDTSISDYLIRYGNERPVSTMFRQKVGETWQD